MTALKVLLICGASALSLVSAARPRWHELETIEYNFDAYRDDFGRVYCDDNHPDPDECTVRREAFETNLALIHMQNARTDSTWRAGVNHLTDRTPAELKAMRGYRPDQSAAASRDETLDAFREAYVPASEERAKLLAAKEPLSLVSQRRLKEIEERAKEHLHGEVTIDWTLKGATTAVKDQGACGSCWAFATAETVESHHMLKHGALASLSPQQVAMCSPNPKNCGGTGGCGGGTAEVGFAGIIQAGGLGSEWTDPYVSHSGKPTMRPCIFDLSSGTRPIPAAVVTSYVKLPENEYAPVLDALAHSGPLAVAVDASTWHLYESGIFDAQSCHPESPDIDHLVQLVGAGRDKKTGKEYWKIRNSWTPTWGEQGHIYLERQGANPKCGIDDKPSDGSGCDDGPKAIKACGTCGVLYDVSYPKMK
jgi:cathepsin L